MSLRPLRHSLAALFGIMVAGCVSVPTTGPQSTTPPATFSSEGPLGVIVPYPVFAMAKAKAETALRVPDEPLEPFFAALDDLTAGKIKTVNVLQLGDSHTAGDGFSGHLRLRLQQRFGNAGRGMLPPGDPFPYYRPTDVNVSSKGWSTLSSFSGGGQGPFGVTGFRSRATQASARMVLQPQGEVGFEQVEVEVMLQPGGGTLLAFADGVEVAHASTRDQGTSTGLMRLPLTASAKHIELSTKGDGPVDVLAWSVARKDSGVVLDSQGIVGTTVSIMDRWDKKTLAWELANRHPALILMVYGTNEGFADGLSKATYTSDFNRQLAMLRQLAPWAAILVVGPPDGQHLPSSCPAAHSPKTHYTCAPLTASERTNYAALFINSRPKGKACRWYAPPNLEVVKTVQKDAAKANRAGFWDWSSVMGNPCGLHQWATMDPPLAARDHIHLSTLGYNRSADALYDDLMARYGAWRVAVPRTASTK